MKALDHKRLLDGLGLTSDAVYSLVMGDVLRRFKDGFLTRDEVHCELIVVGYREVKGAIRMKKASGDALEKAVIIL